MEIIFDNISVIYKDIEKEKQILQNIDLKIKSEKITGIIGPSGSGKTTLIELISGLKKATKGKIIVGETTIEPNKKILKINELRKKIGIVFQFPEEQIFNTTVEKEIAFSLKNFNFKTNVIDKQITKALLMVGLDDSYKSKDPYTLSSGEIRKVAIASILAYNPDVIIFDEPTVGLDNISKSYLVEIIKKLKTRYKKTIIVVTHDIEFLIKIVDDVVVLKNGKILINGTKKKVFSETKKLKDNGIPIPKVILFKEMVFDNKNVKLPYREDINDLIKDIYRYAK
ncbi:MAG: ATP-binding cassette domain-containing protein [Mycoplasmatota bacterium]